MAKKKTSKTTKHRSFQITPPKPTYGKLYFYLVVAGTVGMMIGMYFGNQVIIALANYTPAP
jgi:hypothetical protein